MQKRGSFRGPAHGTALAKALAEVAALLVLQKKVQELFPAAEDDELDDESET